MAGFLTQGWDLFPPRYGRTSSHNLPAISRWCWGFYTVRCGVDPGDRRSCPRWLELLVCAGIPERGIGFYPPSRNLIASMNGMFLFSTNLLKKSQRRLAGDLIGQSDARIDIQSYSSKAKRDRCHDCLGMVGNAQPATTSARRGVRPAVLLVVPPTLPTHTARRG